MADKFKTVPLDSMIDKHIGKPGTKRRDAFESELRVDLLGQAASPARAPHDTRTIGRTGRRSKSTDF